MPLNTPQEQDAQFAADFSADVTREQLARVYAEALCNACAAQNVSVDLILEEYNSLIQDILNVYPKYEEILSSAMVPMDEKFRMIQQTFVSATNIFMNFLKTLARRGRLELIRDIYRQTLLLNNKNKGRIPVSIITAEPLEPATEQSMIARLATKLGGEPEISAHVDPNVIGGIIVRVGDTVYDASLATQLKNVRQQMIDRSTHEIQSRRDRFRNTEGN